MHRPDDAPEPSLSQRAAGLKSSAIRDLLALTEKPGVLSLAGGLPAPETFPAERLAVAATRLLESDGAGALQYTTTEGLPRLREWIAARETQRCGRDCSPDDVLVTSGSQQALLLVGLALADPGTPIVVEEPGYLGGLQALRAAGASLVPVRCDEHGLDVDALAARLGEGLRPAAVYTVPSFQNPSGALMPADRRAGLAALADRYGFVVIDDDPYGDLWFDAPPPPPVRAHTDNTAHLGSTSKVVAPGLRVGWVVAPPWLRPALVRLKQAADLQASTLGQALVASLVTDDGWFVPHLDALRATYAPRGRALAAALATAFGERLQVNHPTGGMFLWGRFNDGTVAADLLPRALAHGVGFVPGAEFFTADPDPCAIRLSFATNPPDALAEAASRLAAAHADL